MIVSSWITQSKILGANTISLDYLILEQSPNTVFQKGAKAPNSKTFVLLLNFGRKILSARAAFSSFFVRNSAKV